MLLGVLGAMLLSAGTPPAADAHAELVGATPQPGGSVIESPDAIELRFSEPIDPALAFVDLMDERRESVGDIGPVTVDDDGRTARVSLPHLAAGTYTATYQVVSSVDGHATTGAFAFVIDPTGAQAPPPAPPDASQPAVDGWAIGARWLGLLGGLVALGTLLAWWRSRPLLPRADSGPPWITVGTAGILAYAGLAAYLWRTSLPILETAPERMSGLPLDWAAPFGSTPFAMAMRVALAGSMLTVVLAAAVVGVGRGRHGTARVVVAGTLLATALATVTLAGMSMAAHAAASGGVLFGLVDLGHLVAVAAWLGGLPAILVLGRRAQKRRDLTMAMLRHHGPMALVAAPIVVLTGLANSSLVLGSSRGLVASEYGNLLLAKVMLLAVALGIGAVNHFALRGRGRASVSALLGAELVVAALAIGAAATMVTVQPAAARQPAVVSVPVAPAHLFGRAGPASVHVTVDPPSPGPQQYLVTVADAETGEPRSDVQLAFLELASPDGSDRPVERVQLEPDGDDPRLFRASGALMSVEGDWTLDVVVRRRGSLDERAVFTVPVRRPAPPQLVMPPDTGVGVPAPLGALWGLLPDGPTGWLPALVAVAALLAVGRTRPAWPFRTGLRIGVAAMAVVAVLAVGTRTVVMTANAPTRAELDEHVPDADFVPSPGTGEAIYRANCAACHGSDGSGEGPVRTLPPAGPLAEAVARMTPAELSYRIANGLAGTAMPAFAATLTDDERWQLVTYLEDQWRRP
ncbi:MAG: copper resistance protein CopC [Chloroflexi bacterium]|nr:copper resistance protein CopC [Chloroflexota bacterium]